MAGSLSADSMDQHARDLALQLRSRGDAASGSAVTEIRDAPTPWLTFEFTLYDFLPIAFFYDRGYGGFSVVYGARRVSLLKLRDDHFVSGRVDVKKAVDEVLTAVRLRIPDKFLEARGWQVAEVTPTAHVSQKVLPQPSIDMDEPDLDGHADMMVMSDTDHISGSISVADDARNLTASADLYRPLRLDHAARRRGA